jgi:hypothetical protein
VSQYYYFVASLPGLSYETERAQTPESFLEDARAHLSRGDAEALMRARIDAPVELESGPQSVVSWQRFERGLRNALVRIRAARKGVDATEYIRADEHGRDDSDRPGLEDAAREAFGEESPLSGEAALNRLRWAFLDELEVGHFFDLDRVIIHYLKLQILARKAMFTREDGERVFTAATEKITNDYYQEQGV